MLAQHQPAHVREEEATLRVVRIGIGVREFVMHPVIPDPLVNMVLHEGKNEKQYFLIYFHILEPKIKKKQVMMYQLTWKATVCRTISISRNGHLALYALCAHNLCAPAVIPTAAKPPSAIAATNNQIISFFPLIN